MTAAKPTGSLKDVPAVEADERHQAEVDAFVERNRGPLNASIRRSRAELAEGVQARRTIDDIVKDGRLKGGQG